jgi:cellulose synthase/poly-beta-1,6-N-acetylglucosamine synthase-like glycosyltransferase
MRRQALLSIGGFPTTCLTEDVYSSMLMMSKGWKTAYIPEALQYGLVPDTFEAHIKQLVRWVRRIYILCPIHADHDFRTAEGCKLP